MTFFKPTNTWQEMVLTTTISNYDPNSADNMARLNAVRDALLNKLEEYPSKKIGFKLISEGSGISERTLRRIAAATHNISFQTVFKLYRYLFGLLNDKDTFDKLPDVMKDIIMKEYANFSLNNDEARWLPIIDEYLLTDSVFRGIYIETACGSVHKEKIAFEYGQQGIRILEKMVNLNVIKEIEPSLYTASTDRATLQPKVLKHISQTLIETYFSPEKLDVSGESFAQVLMEGVDVDTYNELLKLDYETKNKRLKIIQDGNAGNIKYWMINIVDTLSKEFIYKDNDVLDYKKGGKQ